MATLKQIQFKRSKVAGVRPTPAQLAEGELAINLKDRLLFTKDDTGAIIDLGFAKGGNIDGNVIHKGNYTQTGTYTIAGAISQTSGHFTTTGNITATGDITAKARLMTDNGEVLVRGTGTTHVRFQDLADARERGIIYSQNRAGDTKQILNVRVQDYTNSTSNIFAFNGDGLFYAPSISAGTSVKSPVIYTNTVNTGSKNIGDYDISSLANNNSDTDKNYLRVVRTDPASAILHEICENNGISWYSGSSPTEYMLSFSYSGGVQAGHSIAVGIESGPMVGSALGKGSIALGDTDTGLKWHQDGYFHTVNNGTRTFIYGPEETQSLRKMVMGYSPDGVLMTTPPAENYALATVVTYHDNNAYGDGQTLLGYYQGGNYHHYFRGKGTTNVNTAGGLLVTPGNIDVVGGSVNIDGRNNASTLLFKGNTTGSSSVDNMTIAVWGNTFTNVDGDRKNVMEISDATSWIQYYQRLSSGAIQSHLNGTLGVNESINVGQEVNVSGTIAGNAVNALRIWNDDYAAIFRRSEGSLHIIPTAFGEGKTGGIGPLRPFSLALDTGKVSIPDLQSRYNTITANGYIKFVGHGAGAGGYDIQYAQAAPVFQEIDDDAVSKYYPIVKQKFLQGKAVWSLGTEIESGTFVLHHLKEDGTGGHTSRFNADGTVNFPGNVQVGGGRAIIAENGNIFSDIWETFTSAGDITNIRDAIATRVSKEGDTMTGKLTIAAADDALVIRAPNATNSSHIRSEVGGANSWFVGKGGESGSVSFYNYKTTTGIDLSDNRTIGFSPGGFGLVNMSENRMYVNATRWVSQNPGAINPQYGLEAPIFVEHGELNGNVYYPIIKGRSSSAGHGYTSSVELGTLRSGTAAWATGCIIVRSAENTPEQGHPAAIYQFLPNGQFTSPGRIISGWAGMGVGVEPAWSSPCIAIGDADTGLVWESDGIYNMYANGQGVFSIRAGLAQTFGDVALHANAGLYVRDNIDVNDVYIRSDIRCKSEIKLIDNAQEKSKLLGGYTYLLKNSVTDEVKPSAGLIAQEVQKVLPELVTEDKETGLLRLNYNGIIGLNTATINEHTDEIKELKSEIAELKALIKSLL